MGAAASRASNIDVDACDTLTALPSATLSSGEPFDFANTRGKVVLIANVASYCGLTKENYADFVELEREFGEDLLILAFPCNQFLFQEPLGSAKACAFARRGGFRGEVFEKVRVNGSNTSHVFAWLKKKMGVKRINWNFGKFLIDRRGVVRAYHGPRTRPTKFRAEIQALLNESAAA